MASIRRRKGKWQAQVRRQGHRQLARSFIHRRDAEAWARQAEAELDRAALPVDPRKLKALTFGELLERYAAEVTPRKRGAYAEMSRVRLLRGAAIYRVGLAQLTANHIEDYLRGRQSTVCGETARKDGILIRQVIASASRLWGIKLGSNPALQVKLPPPSNPRTRRLAPSDHEKLRQALARQLAACYAESRMAFGRRVLQRRFLEAFLEDCAASASSRRSIEAKFAAPGGEGCNLLRFRDVKDRPSFERGKGCC